MPNKPFTGRGETLSSRALSSAPHDKPDRTISRAFTSTYDPNAPLPKHRINVGTGVDLVWHQRGVVMSTHAIRRLPISKQIVDRVLYVDPAELLAAVDAKFAAAPIIASGVKLAGPDTPPAPRPRAIRSPRPTRRSRSGAPT
jgi:hypothetical protein